MKRLLLLLALLIAPCAPPEGAERVFRLGQLIPSAATLEYTRKVTFLELAQLGFEEGRNLVVEERVGGADAVDGLAQELVATKPDAIIAMGSDATRSAGRDKHRAHCCRRCAAARRDCAGFPRPTR